jgi:TonB family protein
MLFALIREDGSVGDIRVIKSLDSRLDESAALALSKWKFRPARNPQGPVEVEALVEVPFRLRAFREAGR